MSHPSDADIASYQQAVLDYLSFKLNSCYAYDELDWDSSGPSNFFKAGLVWFSLPENSIGRIRAEASTGNSFSRAELGLYYYAGMQNKKDPLAAESLWTEVAESPQTPNSLRARVFSYLANLYVDRASASDRTGNPDPSLYAQAAVYALKSLQLGLTSPTVLSVAKNCSGVRGAITGMRDPLQPLWDALDRRQEEMEAEDAAQERRVAKAPNKYRCANPDCSVECFRRGPLFKCAGSCNDAYKPYYCGKNCQKAHWKKHKPFCKPDAIPNPVAEAEPGTLKPPSRKHDAQYQVDLWSWDGAPPSRTTTDTLAARVTGNDGSTTLFSSSTLGPETLREFTKKLEKAEI